MIIKYVREIEDRVEEVLLKKELDNKVIPSKEDVAELREFDNLEIVSLRMDFTDGIKVKETQDLANLSATLVKQMIITVK